MCIVLTKSSLIGKQSTDIENSQVGYRLWVEDTEGNGDVKLSPYTTEGVAAGSLDTLPIAYNTQDYWYAYLSPYDIEGSTIYGTSYAQFKNNKSFNARLKNVLSHDIPAINPILENQTLTKLNVELDDNGVPIPGSYYINAAQLGVNTIIDQETGVETKERIAYT
jgi:hypothetical protein